MTSRSKKYNYNISASGNFVTNNLNLGVSNMFSGSFSASNNVSSATDVTGLSFNNSTTRYFNCQLTVSIARTTGGNLYELFTLEANQSETGWELYETTISDITGVQFSITSTGKVQYTSSNISNFISSTFRYTVTQITTNGTYSNLTTGTQGTYILNSIQLTNTVGSIIGTDPGAFYVMGGSTFDKMISIRTTDNAVGFGTGGALSVYGGAAISKNLLVNGNIGIGTVNPVNNLDVTGTARITSSVTTEAVYASNSTISNVVFTNNTIANSIITNLSCGSVIVSGNSTFGSNVVVAGPVLQIPTGDIATRPDANLGYIRYNTETSQFEGYGPGNAWGSLGGVVDIAQTTKVLASANPSVTDGNLYFYTVGTERVRINSEGNIGIGTTAPANTLDVTGTVRITTSVTTGAVYATNTTVTNAVATNITTATLNASTSITAASAQITNLNVTSITASTLLNTNTITTVISAGTAVATTYTGGSMSLSGNLAIGGTLTTVNITTTNLVDTNVSAGTITATNQNSTNITASTLNASTGITAASAQITNANITTITTSTLLNTNQNSTNITTATLNASTGITAGSAQITNANITSITTSTLLNTNAVSTNVTTATLNASIGITAASAQITNANITSITAATMLNTNAISTNITTATLNASTGITVATLLNTNQNSTNITTATLNASTGITAASAQITNANITNITVATMLNTNAVSTNITTATLNASTGITAASAQITNLNVITQTVGISRITTSVLALGNSNTLGNIFTTAGNVGIGTVEPAGMLHLNGSALFTSTGNLTCTGDIISFGSLSDKRLKHDIQELQSIDAINVVNTLRPVKFKWNENISNIKKRGSDDIGFIAQEVEEVVHYAVDDFVDIADNKQYKCIKYERLIPYLVGSIQDLSQELQMTNQELQTTKDELQILKTFIRSKFLDEI